VLSFLCLTSFLSSCSKEPEQKRVVVGESEIITLPSGKKNYSPISQLTDLENAIYVQETPGGETIHLEFDTDGKRFIARKNGEHTSSLIYENVQIKTYLDVYEILTNEKTITFVKIGPRLIEDE